jgi:hypothetical protein
MARKKEQIKEKRVQDSERLKDWKRKRIAYQNDPTPENKEAMDKAWCGLEDEEHEYVFAMVLGGTWTKKDVNSD